jgi:hypothetical protein
VLRKGAPGPRQQLYLALHQVIRPLPAAEQLGIMDQLMAWAGQTPIARSSHRTLAPDELLSLVRNGIVDAAAHSVTHPVLSRCPVPVQEDEIRGSKTQLEEILGRPVSSFAYPYGFRSDYTARTVALVKRAGFACACAAFTDVVWRGSDRYQLPRVIVFDWPGEEFARRLTRWFQG